MLLDWTPLHIITITAKLGIAHLIDLFQDKYTRFHQIKYVRFVPPGPEWSQRLQQQSQDRQEPKLGGVLKLNLNFVKY